MKQLTFLLFVIAGILPACSQNSKEIHFKGEMARKAVQIGSFYVDPDKELSEDAKERLKHFEDYVKKQDAMSEEEQEKDVLWMNYKMLREAGLTDFPIIHLVNEEGELRVAYLSVANYEPFKPFTLEYLKSHIVNVEFKGKEIDFGEEYGSVYKLDKLIDIKVSEGESKFIK